MRWAWLDVHCFHHHRSFHRGAEMMLFKVLERLDRQRLRAAICNRFTDDALVTKAVEALCRMS